MGGRTTRVGHKINSNRRKRKINKQRLSSAILLDIDKRAMNPSVLEYFIDISNLESISIVRYFPVTHQGKH